MNKLNLNPISKLWTKNLFFLLLSNLLICMGFYMLIPTLPTYVMLIGGSNFQASLVISIFSISALILRSITGNAADALGRKPLLIIGFCFLIFSNISYFWLSVAGIIILRLFHGIGWGMASTTMATIVSDIVPGTRRGEGMGYYSLSMVTAMSIGTIAAIIIMNYYNFKVILFISIILLGIGILLSQAVSIPHIIKNKNDHVKIKFSFSDLFEKRALFPSLLCFLLSITLCGVMSYIIPFGKEIGITNIWVYFIGHVLMILVTRPFVGKIFDRRGHFIVVFPGAILIVVGLVILSLTTSIPSLITASVFYGLGYGAVQPSLQAWAINRSSVERKGAANGTFLSSIDLGFTVGSVVLSFIAGNKSYAEMYRMSSIFMVLFILIYGFSLIKKKDCKNDDILEKEIA